MNLYPKLILDALTKVRYPGTGKNIVEAEMVADDIRIDGSHVSFSLIFEKHNDAFAKSVARAAQGAVEALSPDVKCTVSVIKREKAAPETALEKPLSNVKHIIAIGSGKGGVGKSAVAANTAVALASMGYKVGLLDADIYGPSQPKMFGVEDARPIAEKVGDKEMIQPVERYGVKLLSIGFFVNPDDAIVWRGAMASNAIRQLLTEAAWGALDFLLLDLPPGTSDIHLTVVQTISLSGAVIVSTPQDVSLADARKAISMFTGKKINVPIIGLVENMAWFTPAELPDNKYYIFGREGCARLAQSLGVPLLAQIPLVQSICECGDAGAPAALKQDTASGMAFRRLAEKIAAFQP